MTDWSKIQDAVKKEEARRQTEVYPKLSQGYSFEAHGRSGSVYFKSGEKVLDLFWEMSGVDHYDILLLPWDLSKWTHPVEPIPKDERDRIMDGLEEFLKKKKIRSDAFAPLKTPLFPNTK